MGNQFKIDIIYISNTQLEKILNVIWILGRIYKKDRRHNYNSNIIYSTHMAKQNYEGGWNIICSVLFCEINYIYTIFSKTLYLFIISQE